MTALEQIAELERIKNQIFQIEHSMPMNDLRRQGYRLRIAAAEWQQSIKVLSHPNEGLNK